MNAADALSLVVVVPAHDEELVLAATLGSLRAQNYPAACYEVVVVADNCADATSAIARAHGAIVLERVDPQQRGKGYALDWAFSHLLHAPVPADAYVIVDADTWAAPDFLTRMTERLTTDTDADGLCALQGRYGVLNSGEGWRAALMTAAFDLVNHVRPLGRDRLGLGVGLKGNGMAFTRATLQQARWRGDSVTEDLDYGLDLARNLGLRVRYVPEARVLAQMPTSAKQATSQRQRWETGRYKLVRERALPLLWEGIRRRRALLCDAAWDLLMPPLAELCGLLALWLTLIGFGAYLGWLPHALLWAQAATLCAVGLAGYVLGGLRLAGAPAEAYAALLRAPFYAVWKVCLYARPRQTTKAGDEWVRTARAPIAPPASAAPLASEEPPAPEERIA